MLIARRKDQAKYPQAWDELAAAWYPGVGPSGNRLYDLSGRDNHSTLTNGPTWVDGLGGKAIQLDGVNDHISTGFSLLALPVTITAWVRPVITDQFHTLIGDQDVSLYVFNDNRKLRLFSSGGVSTSGNYLVDNVWQHVAYRWDGSTVQFFYNGQRVETLALAGTLAINNLSIGLYGASSLPYAGAIGDILIYTKLLPTDGVKLLARRPGIAFEPKRRVFYSIPASVKAWLFRRQSQIIGGGLG